MLEIKNMNLVRANLQLKLRRNRGQLLKGGFAKALSEVLGLGIQGEQFVDILETERIKKWFYETGCKKKNVIRGNLSTKQSVENDKKVEEVAYLLGETPVILFSENDRYLGGVRVLASNVLKKYKEVWDVVGADLAFVSSDRNVGFCLELNYYTISGEYRSGGVVEYVYWWNGCCLGAR